MFLFVESAQTNQQHNKIIKGSTCGINTGRQKGKRTRQKMDKIKLYRLSVLFYKVYTDREFAKSQKKTIDTQETKDDA